MSILVRFTPTGLTAAKYDETLVQTLKASGPVSARTASSITCAFGPDDNVRVSEIWDSPRAARWRSVSG